jgi:hypothetical protein
VQHVDDHVSHVDQGEKDIQQMQREEMKLTNLVNLVIYVRFNFLLLVWSIIIQMKPPLSFFQLLKTQEKYREMLQRQWEEWQKLREKRLLEVRLMREQREHLLQQHMFEEARRLEEAIGDTLEEADYIPRTTLA